MTALKNTNQSENETIRQPAIFLGHGAGPIPYLDHIQSNKNSSETFVIESFLQVGKLIKTYSPKAICVISAHWEEDIPNIIYQPSPPLLYDYYGFPKAAYKIKYNAKCDLKLSSYCHELLTKAGFKNVQLNKKRGWDHGLFIPLVLAYPKADIPLIQISLHRVKDDPHMKPKIAELNLRLGSILKPLRNMGVMIIGSGSSYHARGDLNMKKNSAQFNQWLKDTLGNAHLNRKNMNQAILSMKHWHSLSKSGKECHRREEHLLPLHVCLGSCVSVQEFDALMNNQKEVTSKDEVDGCSKVRINSGIWIGARVSTVYFE